jgi:hypothetical protein
MVKADKLNRLNRVSLLAENGATFTLPPQATTYTASSTAANSLIANGVGSLLDVSSLTTMVAGTDWDTDVQAISGGRVDLSGLTAVTTGAVDFYADGLGSMIDISNLEEYTATNNFQARIRVANGGVIKADKLSRLSGAPVTVTTGGLLRIGRISPNVGVTISVSGVGSVLDVTRDFQVTSGHVTVANGASLEIGGNFSRMTNNVDHLPLGSVAVTMDGTGGQQIDAAGRDLGVGGSTSGNFGFGQLVLGTANQPTAVHLADQIDNGNRGPGGQLEALYLFGLNNQAGLRVRNDSVLVLGEINAYAFDPVAGTQVHLNSLLGSTVQRIAFDQGFLQRAPLVFQWTNSAGGNFAAVANWGGGLLPLAADAAIWNLNSQSGYTVQFDRNVTTDSAIIKRDKVIFNLGGFRYALGTLNGETGLVIGQDAADDAHLTVMNGTLTSKSARVGSAAASRAVLTIADTGIVEVLDDLVIGTGQGKLVVAKNGVVEGNGAFVGEFENQAGIVTPGIGTVGILNVEGGYRQLADGALQVELGGTSNSNPLSPQFDQLVVDGAVSLGGSLNVSLVNLGAGILVPKAGDVFPIITASEITSDPFGTMNLPEIDAGLVWRIRGNHGFELLVAPKFDGDYNGDGAVNAADYVVWRNTLGQVVSAGHAADGNADGTVNANDYAVWRANFGATASSMAVENSAIPEPAAWLLAVFGLAINFNRSARNRQKHDKRFK